MPALATRIEREAGRTLSPTEIFTISASRETALSRLLTLYICTGLAFMLLPGTFLGVWNLITISAHRSSQTVSASWIQAHGHAQIFGWIGTFILGIGFYSIPKLRRLNSFGLSVAYLAWGLWTLGVTAHWLCSVYYWHWRILLLSSSVAELAAFLIFFRTVSGHRPEASGKQTLEPWVFVVIVATIGLLATLVLNLGVSIWVARRAVVPEIPASFDQKLLVLETWGFLVPFVWGFSAKWLPVFLGLRPARGKLLLGAVGINTTAIVVTFIGWTELAMLGLVAATVVAATSLGLFSPAERPAKLNGVHSTMPFFVRLAYLWALVAALLGVWAASFTSNAHGIWGASRHALTVGFLATMVFAIGQRVLPAFSGMKLLFSTKLMFAALLLLTLGCLLRVSSEILAYQDFIRSAWSWLPLSAVTELTAVTIFAINLFATFISKAPAPQRHA
jgi:uncharacterized protein involved in response to NO